MKSPDSGPNKKMVSFRLSPELQARIARIASATRLKKTAIIEMCVEMELPHVEEKYAEDIEDWDRKHPAEVAALVKRGFFAQKVSYNSTSGPRQISRLNETPEQKKKAG